MTNEKSLLNLQEVAEMFDVKPATIIRWVAEGLFPQPLRVGIRFQRWHRASVESILYQNIDKQILK